MKRAGILGLAIVLVLGLTVGASHAAKPKAKKVASEVDIDAWDNQPGFDLELVGNVYSKQPKCVRNREVTLFGGSVEPVGTATTDRTGEWRVSPDPLFAGSYEARVSKKQARTRGKKLVCKADTSPNFVLPP